MMNDKTAMIKALGEENLKQLLIENPNVSDHSLVSTSYINGRRTYAIFDINSSITVKELRDYFFNTVRVGELVVYQDTFARVIAIHENSYWLDLGRSGTAVATRDEIKKNGER